MESSERVACECCSREGLRLESKPVQSCDDGPFFCFPKQTSWLEKGKWKETGGEEGPQSFVSRSALAQTYGQIGEEEKKGNKS